MIKKRWKKTANAILLFVIFALTMISVLRGEDFGEVMAYIRDASPAWIVPAISCVLFFILGESVVICHLLRTLSVRTPFWHCCLFSFTGFFYSCITPSASGGQPMQMMMMRRDGIPVAVSAVVLAIVTITYKLVLVLTGAVVMLLRVETIMVHLDPVESVIYLGMALNVACIAGLMLSVFHPNLARRMAQGGLNLLGRIRPMRNPQKQMDRLDRVVKQYEGTAVFFRTNRKVIAQIFCITLLQRFALFVVTWLVYRSFDLQAFTMPVITTLQSMISVAADMMPLPGGMGVSENLFMEIFKNIFGEELVLPGLMLSRGISYYTQLLISAIMTLAAPLLLRHRRREYPPCTPTAKGGMYQ